MNDADRIQALADALDVLAREGFDAALALLVRRGVPEGEAREELYVASHPDPLSLAGRI